MLTNEQLIYQCQGLAFAERVREQSIRSLTETLTLALARAARICGSVSYSYNLTVDEWEIDDELNIRFLHEFFLSRDTLQLRLSAPERPVLIYVTAVTDREYSVAVAAQNQPLYLFTAKTYDAPSGVTEVRVNV